MTTPTKTTDRATDIIGTRQTREIRVEARALDREARTVELAFSSTAPVERWFGEEILDHAAASVRMERIRDGAPLLLDHSSRQQIGVIDSARIDADGVGRAQVRFSRGALGEEILQDVADGIRTKVSVGYLVHQMDLEASGDDGDRYRITDWEPMEVSIVSIPADASVGVGRAQHPQPEIPMPKPAANPNLAGDPVDTRNHPAQDPANPPVTDRVNERANTPGPDGPDPLPAAAAPVVNPEAEQIRAVGAHFNLRDQAEDHIMLGGNLADFRASVRQQQRPDPVPTAPRIQAHIPHAGKLRAYRPELYAGGRREAEEQAYRAGQWARANIFGRADAARWCRDHGVQLHERILTGIGAGQSVLIPDELVLPIISLREQYGLARRACRIHPMSGDTASVPRDTGDADAYFVGREQAPETSDPSFDNINLTAKNVAAETRISNDYAEDSVINLADYVADKHARAFAVKEDVCLINGDGTSPYGGIVGLRNAILGLAGAVEAAGGHNTFDGITAVDLRNLMAVLPDFPGINPNWYTSKPGQNRLFGRLTDAAGGNTKRELAAAMPEQWGGYGIQTSPAMPKQETALTAEAMILFGDLAMGVIFGDRRGMTMMVDPYSLSSYQQVKIISSERFDINCHGVGDAENAGPVVALIGKA